MIVRNYIITGLRNMLRNFSYSTINIGGLALGIASCLLLVLWILNETSYDSFHKNRGRLFRASLATSFNGIERAGSTSPTALTPALSNFPEVERVVKIYNPSATNPFIVLSDDKMFQETRYLFADSNFFNVFSFPLLQGDPATALREPQSVVLTVSMAKKYFGDEDAMGKIISLNNIRQHTVTGIAEDVPENSQIKFDFIASFNSLSVSNSAPAWWPANYQTYFLLREKSDPEALWKKLNDVVSKALASRIVNQDDYIRYDFMRLSDIHLRSTFGDEPEIVGSLLHIKIFSTVAFLILLIAAMNYINLATSRGMERAKEVGIRKVIGAWRFQLFKQFMGEAFLMAIFAALIAVIMIYLSLPYFNMITGKTFVFADLATPPFLSIAVAIFLFISVLSGAYPAIALSGFKPVAILKGSFRFSSRGTSLRKVLVAAQFAISIILILSTLVVSSQMNLLQNKNLGYKKDNVVILPLDSQSKPLFDQVRSELKRNNIATAVGRATESPISIKGGYNAHTTETEENESSAVTAIATDEEFASTLKLNFIKGRNFAPSDFERLVEDTTYSFIVNEAALKTMSIQLEEAIGKEIVLSGRKGSIVGIVKDFHYQPLHRPIGPLIMFNQNEYNYMFVRLEGADPVSSLEQLRKICRQLLPHRPFEFQFLDQQYERLYNSEQRMYSIFGVFAVLSILISSVGLLGLVSYTTMQRTKELGVRKVLGATSSNLVFLVLKDYGKLIAMGLCIGFSIGYYTMTMWLNNFAYRESIQVSTIFLAGLICCLGALVTCSFHAWRAAVANPAQSLRNE